MLYNTVLSCILVCLLCSKASSSSNETESDEEASLVVFDVFLNSTDYEIQSYLNVDENHTVPRILTPVSRTNATPTVFLDKSKLNTTDEEARLTSASGRVAVFRKITADIRAAFRSQETEGHSFVCSNVTLRVEDYHAASPVLQKKLKLIFSHINRTDDTVTVCKSVGDLGFFVFEEKVIFNFPPTVTIAVSSSLYTSISLLCALACIISVPKFILIFTVSGILTYIPIYALFIRPVPDVLIYFLPFHLNFFFLLVTGWATLLSCKVVFKMLMSQNFFRVVNGAVVANTFHVLMLATSVHCISFGISLLETCYMDHLIEPIFLRLLSHCTLTVFLLYFAVMSVDRVFASLRKRTEDVGSKHTRCYSFFMWYHLLALATWVSSIGVVCFSSLLFLWKLYLCVTVCLPLFFLKDVVTTATRKVSVHVTRIDKNEDIFHVRIRNAYIAKASNNAAE